LVGENGDTTRGRDYVDKIEDSELRQKTRAYLDIAMTLQAVNKKDTDLILELVRTGELTHLQKAWALAAAAKILAKTDHDKSLAVTEDAAAEARRIEGSDPDRPRALMAVANALLVSDRGKSWDATTTPSKQRTRARVYRGRRRAPIRLANKTDDYPAQFFSRGF